jgi:poly[ADP-ribose] polymerase 16
VTLFPFYVFKFEKIQQLTGAPHTPVPTPDFLFEIEYFDPANSRFYETKGERDLIYAFHGSRLENFHSIIHNGLHCHLNKVSLEHLLRSTGGACTC